MRVLRVSMSFVLMVAGLFPCIQSKAAAPVKAIRFGKLVDGAGKVLTNAIVIVDGDRIKSINTDNSSIPAGAEIHGNSRAHRCAYSYDLLLGSGAGHPALGSTRCESAGNEHVPRTREPSKNAGGGSHHRAQPARCRLQRHRYA